MVTIQYYENNSLFLSQLVHQVPSVDENIKIKGKKAKVIRVDEVNKNLTHVHIVIEKIVKKPLLSKELQKKKR
jgi:hypothetical protein